MRIVEVVGKERLCVVENQLVLLLHPLNSTSSVEDDKRIDHVGKVRVFDHVTSLSRNCRQIVVVHEGVEQLDHDPLVILIGIHRAGNRVDIEIVVITGVVDYGDARLVIEGGQAEVNILTAFDICEAEIVLLDE